MDKDWGIERVVVEAPQCLPTLDVNLIGLVTRILFKNIGAVRHSLSTYSTNRFPILD